MYPRILFLFRYGEVIDQEIVTTEQIVTQSCREEGTCHGMKGHMEKNQGWSGG